MNVHASVSQTAELTVDNPYYGPAAPEEHRVVRATRALRGDPLAKLHHTRRIDDAEYRAGRRMQALLEAAEVGRVRSQDPSNEPVDGGGHVPDIMSDRQLRAIRSLQAIWIILGQDGALLARAVLADGMMPEEYGRKAGARGIRDISHYGWLFAQVLARLARHLGLAS